MTIIAVEPKRGSVSEQKIKNQNDPSGASDIPIITGTCFAKNSTAATPNGPKTMDELKVGDKVLIATNGGSLAYQPIKFFLHRDPEFQTKFLQIRTETGDALTLTPEHLLYKAPTCSFPVWEFNFRATEQLALAKELKIGHCLFITDSKKFLTKISRIEKITESWKKGIYSPITDSGVIVADNVIASCYSNTKVPNFVKTWFAAKNLLAEKFGNFLPKTWTSALHEMRSEVDVVELPAWVKFVLEHLQEFSL